MNTKKLIATLVTGCAFALLSAAPAFAADAKANPCNPCAPKASNPCAAKAGMDKKTHKKKVKKAASNPCAPKNPCAANPCAPKK